MSIPHSTRFQRMSGDERMASIIIGDARALAIFTVMLEKHEKGTIATKNTVEAFGGDSHAMDSVLAHIAKWRRETALQTEALAPKGDAAVAGTPIGNAIADATSARIIEGDERAAGDGVAFAPWVPRPRPSVGQFVRWPGGTATSITRVLGFRHDALTGTEPADYAPDMDFLDRLREEGVYEVVDTEGWQGYVFAHFDAATAAIDWRTAAGEYDTPRAVPLHTLEDAMAELTDDALAGSVDSYADADDDVRPESPAEAAARKADDELGEAPHDPSTSAAAKRDRKAKTTTAKGSAPAPSKQRERNASTNGIRPAPKPTSGGKRTGRKGGR